MYKDERQIAKKAEEMLQAALRQKVSGFKQHAHRTPDAEQKALKNATAKARVKKYVMVREDTAQFYMRSLAIKMDRHGFVQHYGIDIIRESGERKRTEPRTTVYASRLTI